MGRVHAAVHGLQQRGHPGQEGRGLPALLQRLPLDPREPGPGPRRALLRDPLDPQGHFQPAHQALRAQVPGLFDDPPERRDGLQRLLHPAAVQVLLLGVQRQGGQPEDQDRIHPERLRALQPEPEVPVEHVPLPLLGARLRLEVDVPPGRRNRRLPGQPLFGRAAAPRLPRRRRHLQRSRALQEEEVPDAPQDHPPAQGVAPVSPRPAGLADGHSPGSRPHPPKSGLPQRVQVFPGHHFFESETQAAAAKLLREDTQAVPSGLAGTAGHLGAAANQAGLAGLPVRGEPFLADPAADLRDQEAGPKRGPLPVLRGPVPAVPAPEGTLLDVLLLHALLHRKEQGAQLHLPHQREADPGVPAAQVRKGLWLPAALDSEICPQDLQDFPRKRGRALGTGQGQEPLRLRRGPPGLQAQEVPAGQPRVWHQHVLRPRRGPVRDVPLGLRLVLEPEAQHRNRAVLLRQPPAQRYPDQTPRSRA